MLTADDLTLITDPEHPLLHTPTNWVEDVSLTREYVPAMIALLRRLGGVGLSANQVGISDNVFVTNLDGDWPRVVNSWPHQRLLLASYQSVSG